MNYLTIVFLEKLSNKVSCSGLLLEKLRRELYDDAQRRLQKQLLDSSIYLSTSGKGYRARIDQWFSELAHIETISQTELQYRRLLALESEAEELHKETQRAIASPGNLNPEKLHCIFKEEKDDALNRLTGAVRFEMYRLVAAGGGTALSSLPLLKYIHVTVEAYYDYYVRNVLPAIESLEHRKRFGVWAYQFKEQSKLGGLIKLPVYLESEPKSLKRRMILGETEQITSGSNLIWQGIGAITNITPDTIAAAQEKGIRIAVKATHLMNGHLHESPSQMLDRCYSGEWYAIDPANLFAELNIALLANTLLGRREMRRCLYCGSDGADNLLCLSCISKVRQKI